MFPRYFYCTYITSWIFSEVQYPFFAGVVELVLVVTFEDRTDRQHSFDSCALAYLLTKSSAMCSIGAQMDSLETGTKAYMALYPEGSTDGGENIQKCCFLVYVVKHLSHDSHLLYFHCQAFV